ncbi:2-oxoglutarate and iron-dependent oxygenase domain-containing protein [Streptomyces sp. MST-110588]|uniref:isopenicillin N synthase family dioxygenase n=1 Tax=Streptomyces sp. MST-110588 TaxID=2833628 RepID=UPI001F5C818D|nr:2-oxoglutarate and iron-dependent oxygenase domain-containing protein [Streptomyces sp. MST-110588]UNO41252.1 isopenicillin N synthase family oxygenase [Streptomyces sp. MST-110588]
MADPHDPSPDPTHDPLPGLSPTPSPIPSPETAPGRSRIPVVDLRQWRTGGPTARREIAARVDAALRTAGFLLVTGHGVDAELRAAIRTAAREFFRLPASLKGPYATRVGGRGWLGPGAEANGHAEGTATPPDLKESLSFASYEPTGDAEVDAEWFLPNVWPAQTPRLRPLVERYFEEMRALSDLLLELLAGALGREPDWFTRHTSHPTWGFNINWYPGTEVVGEPRPGQFRIGPHTDFGTVTVLDRQSGKGGLQVFTDPADGGTGWEDAPYAPDSLTVNIGDLMAHWTGGRWRSGRHRVLPPPADAPAEELMSLVFFYECDAGTRLGSAPDSHVYLRQQLDAITVD